MIDAERMLGSLVRSAMSGGGGRRGRRNRRRGRGRSMLGMAGKGALAMGALGVAIAAFEHFTKSQESGERFSGASSTPNPPLPPPGHVAPPPPPPGAPRVASSLPPPPPPISKPGEQIVDSDEAILLVRAMIAAAHADHEVDNEERNRILQALDASGLGDEERQFMLAELDSPADIATLAAKATTPELARQVYLASLMAIEVDTAAEEDYLSRLAAQLGLEETEVAELEGMLDERGGS